MKVAIINSVYNEGSTGKIVAELETCLKENDIERKVFYGRKNGLTSIIPIHYTINFNKINIF